MISDRIDSIIVSGGRGSRLGRLSEEYGCKSLVPVEGIPIVTYLVDSLRNVAPHSKVTFAIDDPSLKTGFDAAMQKAGFGNYTFYEGLPRGPVQAFYEAGASCRTDQAFIFFGNQLVHPNHLEKMLSLDPSCVVLSGFDALSENKCKVATVDQSGSVLDVIRYGHLAELGLSEVHLDVPYLVPNSFFSMETFPELKRLFVNTPMARTDIEDIGSIQVVKAETPPEFHIEGEIPILSEYVLSHHGAFLQKWGNSHE